MHFVTSSLLNILAQPGSPAEVPLSAAPWPAALPGIDGWFLPALLAGAVLCATLPRLLRWLDRSIDRATLAADDQAAARLDRALFHGLRFGLETLAREGADLGDPTARRRLATLAAAYVAPHFPQTLARFDIGGERLAELATARLADLDLPPPSVGPYAGR